MGRPSIAPEMLLRATLLQAFFSVRSERLLMEQINYNLLFRWFVGLPMDAEVWHPTVFTHNRDRLLEAEVAHEFLTALLALPQVKKLLSNEHFSVDGTLIDAWASMKSFRPKDGSGEPPAPGRNGGTQLPQGEALERDACLDHRSRRPALSQGGRPREPAMLHGPCADGEPQRTGGRRDPDARHRHGGARGGACHARPPQGGPPHHPGRRQGLRRDRFRRRPPRPPGDAARRHRRAVSKLGVVRKTAVDGRTTRHPGYRVSQICRKRIEEVFGWIKAQAGHAKSRSEAEPRPKPSSPSRSSPTTSSESPSCLYQLLPEHTARPSTAPTKSCTPKPHSHKTRDFFSSLLGIVPADADFKQSPGA